MAKHLGSRPARGPSPLLRGRLLRGRLSRPAAWAGSCLLAAAAVVGVAAVQGFGDTGPGTVARASAQVGSGVARRAAPSSASESGRAVEVSRQAVRPSRPQPYRVQAGVSLSLRPAVALARKVQALSPTHSSFTIAQSNVLGSQHTAGPGGYGPGTYRAGLTASLLTSRGVGVGGMEEVQSDQLAVLRARMPGYSFWPGSSLGHNGLRLQAYWRSDRFTLVREGTVSYVFSSQRIPLPYVLLRDDQSGAEFWLIVTHNSAGRLQAQRDAATAIEIGLIDQLRATGLPVLIVGDMNEHTAFFCRVSVATGMVAANGGTGAGGCHLPPPPLRVDWIMGGGGSTSAPSAVSFSGYRQDAAGLHRASDHYYLYAEVTTTSDWFAPGTAPASAPGAAP